MQRDGVYVLIFRITDTTAQFNLGVHIEMQSGYGYLSAADWPLLPFYGFMWILYMVFGMVWLVVSFLQWRDLLRVQFWIGAVILLGMLEKATFYAEFQSINNTGKKSQVITFTKQKAQWTPLVLLNCNINIFLGNKLY